MNTAERLAKMIGFSAQQLTIDGVEYVVTTDTGEASYGRDGGAMAFAYRGCDVAAWLGDLEEVDSDAIYSDFCEAISPVADEALAVALAAHGLRLTRGGSCMPVLSDERWAAYEPTEANDKNGTLMVACRFFGVDIAAIRKAALTTAKGKKPTKPEATAPDDRVTQIP